MGPARQPRFYIRRRFHEVTNDIQWLLLRLSLLMAVGNPSFLNLGCTKRDDSIDGIRYGSDQISSIGEMLGSILDELPV